MNNYDLEIPQFLRDKLNLEGSARANKFPDEIKSFMIRYSNFYNWNLKSNYQIIYKLMKNKIKELPFCNYNGCTNNVSVNYKEGYISNGCCTEHAFKNKCLELYGVENPSFSDKLKEKAKETNITRYGCEHAIQSKKIMEKRDKTNIEKYGVKNPMQSETIRHKKDNTMIQKYGVKAFIQLPNNSIIINNIKKYGVEYLLSSTKIQEKIKETNIEKYGSINPIHNAEVLKKQQKTNLEKYGVLCILNSPQSQEQNYKTNIEKYGVQHRIQNKNEYESMMLKSNKTNLERYGSIYPMQNANILEKHQKQSFKRKEYIWKTGEISMVQGNEPIVLKELEEQGYKFDDVLTSPKDMPEITYRLDEKEHRYYPDIFIPKDNIIIEVKSEWTLKLHWDRNQAKFEAAKSMGFNFKLEIR